VAEDFELDTEQLGPLPVINALVERLGLAGLLETFVPHDDGRLKLAPAAAIGVVVRNLVIGRRPVYALGEWAAPYKAGLLGLVIRPGSDGDSGRITPGIRGSADT